MERMMCLLLFIFIPAVLPVTAQSVILSSDGPLVENSPVSFLCHFTSQWNPTAFRLWTGPGSTSLISNGVSTNRDKYSEDVSNAAANHYFSMTIQNYNLDDEGLYQCQYGFAASNPINVSISNTEGVDSTICTDRANLDGFTNVLPICRSGTLTVDRVVVDTYDTGMLGYDSCYCTVRLAQTHTVPVAIHISGYPDTAPTTGCGSILRFHRLPPNTYTEFRCQQIPGDRYSEFAVNELVNITLSRVDNNIQWNSGYCIFIDSNKNMNVTCEEPKTAHTSSTIRLTTKAGTTTTSLSSISPIPRTTFITTDGTYRGCTCGESDLSLVAIIVTIVVSMLVVTVGTVVNILIYKRRVALVNNPKSSTSGMTAPDTVHYDSLDQARVELPNTYEEIYTRQTYVNMAMETK